MIHSKRRVPVVKLLILLILCAAGSAYSADPPATETQSGTSAEPFKEQTVYIPYEELRKVFEREGRGVFLPYERFRELWKAARDATTKPPDAVPPVRALITEMASDAEVATDVVRVTSRIRIELLTDGWHHIPLRLHGAAITSARIANQPARILADVGGGYQLLIERKDGSPSEVELALEYAAAFVKSPGRNSVSFQPPQAPVSRWRVRIPQAGVKVSIHPLIAATQLPQGQANEAQPDETVILAFVGAAPQVRIDWTPRAEGATGLNALVTVESVQWVRLHEGVVRSRTELSYDISRTPIEQLVLTVPFDQKVVGVFDANIRQWSVEQDGEEQRIRAELFEPAQGRQTVVVELERFSDVTASAGADEEVIVPVVRAVGVSRQRGVLAVAVADGLRVEAIRQSGLMQIDAAEVPQSSPHERTADQWTLGYRYAALPFELALRVEKIAPRITMDSLVEAVLEPEELALHVQAVYDIQEAGVFHLELNVPNGYVIRNGRGHTAVGVTPVSIESYDHAQTVDDRTKILINLREKALGRVGFAVDLHKRLNEPDLLRATGKAAKLLIAFPRISSKAVEQATGRLVIYASESLRLNPAAVTGLRSVSLAEAMAGMESIVRHGGPQLTKGGSASGVFAYAFTDRPFALTLKAERRKPHVAVRQLLAVAVEAGVVKYAASFFHDIRYSAVASLRIDIPTDLAAVIQNDTPGVRESVIDPPPDDVSEGYVAWRLRGDTVFKGKAVIRLSWETKLDQLDIGKGVTIAVPRLVPGDVDRAWGQIVLAKAETIDLRAGGGEQSDRPLNLRPIDPQHDLMKGVDSATAQGAARAYEFHDDWVLVVTATRYQLEEIKRTSIERAFLRMVLTRSDQVSAQALYRMRSVRQRLTVRLPEGVAFDSHPVRINNRPVPLERGQKNEYYVPLPGQDASTPFLLEIRYTVPAGSARFVLPEFPSEPAVQKAYLAVYLPPESVFLGSIGPWTDELLWRMGTFFGFKPWPRRHAADLISWVAEGVGSADHPIETFPTDGQMHLFSTLKPLPSPDGDLKLVTLNEDLLNILVFVVVVVGGLTMMRRGAGVGVLAVGALLTVLILLGVFFPTFSRQIMGAPLMWAIVTIAVLWLVRYYGWVRPRDPDIIARRDAYREVRLARIRAKLVPASPSPGSRPPSRARSDSADPADQSGKPADEPQIEPGQNKGGERDE